MKTRNNQHLDDHGIEKPVEPPKWAQHLLRWYCRPELLEDLQGDLNEYFARNLLTKGPKRACWIYSLDVLKFARLYTLRKPSSPAFSPQPIMIGSYLKTSGRSLVRNKLFSIINIVGLSIGLSVGLLVIALIHDLLSYDRFHQNRDRIYRITTTQQTRDGNTNELASTSVKIGKFSSQKLAGVDDVAMLRRGFSGDVTVGHTTLPINGLWATASFFTVFSFPLREGNPATALQEPNSIVLTQKAAHKLFGKASALNRQIRVDSTNFTVTGVMYDIPFFSHLQFEALASFSTLESNPVYSQEFANWKNISDAYVYLLLPPTGDARQIQAGLDRLSQVENARLPEAMITTHLQPLTNIFLGQDLHNEIGHSVPRSVLWVIIGLAMAAILSACFNYTNLSIARSLRRSREVGVRKVLGALRSQVVMQFVVEAVVIALLALLVSVGLFFSWRTAFLSMGPSFAQLDLSPMVVASFLLLAVVVGVLSGLLPAVSLAKINPVQVLKSAQTLKLFRHVNLRKTLIFLQYTFSLCFIASTLIIYTQYDFFISQPLGFSTDNIVNIALQGNSADRVKKEIAQLAGVSGLSQSQLVTGLGNSYSAYIKYLDSRDSVMANVNGIDENYIPLHTYQLVAGRNVFPKSVPGETSEIVVNQQLLKRLNIGNNDPQKAVGLSLVVDGKPNLIVGVLKDFHYGSLYQKVEPAFFRYAPQDAHYLNVRIQVTDWPSTLARLQSTWRTIDRVHPLMASLYLDEIKQFYRPLSMMSKVIGCLAFMTIFIASLGLFGMVVFTAETRLKEVSVRKVLGASEASLVYLLSKGFLGILLAAAFLALPITYLLFDKVVLSQLAYHAPITVLGLLSCLMLFMVIALLIIGSKTIGVARSNPAQVLKAE
jgi:putative ABC transport system permease protein